MTLPNAQTALSAIALVGLLSLGWMLVFVPVPGPNHDMLVYILGSLSGAIVVAGATKAMDKSATTQTGNVTVNADPTP